MRLIIANARWRGGMSGSDNIYLHLAPSWGHHRIWEMMDIDFKPFWLCYIWRIIKGCWRAIWDITNYEFVYSASDFWMDSLPAFILKLKGQKWIAGFYLFAPKSNRVYWLTQKLSYWLILRFADNVFITSEPDRARFPDKKVIVVRGGIDYPETIDTTIEKKYDAIFIGRLHRHKGLTELIQIWKLVLEKRPKARLAIIGDGPLEFGLMRFIEAEDLGDNIDMLGYLEGEALKIIIMQSQICLHPAIYDSGGIACCQAMAYGLPAIGFDLEAHKTYYPSGMMKVTCFDLKMFAYFIDILLTDCDSYRFWSWQARKWAYENSWQKMIERVNADIYTD